MLLKADAIKLVYKQIEEYNQTPDQWVVIDEETLEKSFGWIFFYNTKEFVESCDARLGLAGNGPIFVNKRTGSVEFFGTSKPLGFLIKSYEEKLA